jgi:hypothetical protein
MNYAVNLWNRNDNFWHADRLQKLHNEQGKQEG